MKTVFQFRAGCHLRGDAQAVGERLEAIRHSRQLLTPSVVLDDASNPGSPLHAFFEWDDTVAANRYRVDQAGHLIRSIQVTFVDVEQAPSRQIELAGVQSDQKSTANPVRAFVSIRSDDGDPSYVSTMQAMSDPAMRTQVLKQAHDELAAVGRKYRELSELSQVFQAIESVGAMLTDKRQIA
jgi:hypothetical protein